jgi:HEAT repeat protein
MKLRRRTPPEPPPADPCRALEQRLREWVPYTPGLGDWLKAQQGLEPCIEEGLRRCFDALDWRGFQLYVIAALTVPSRTYTETLCAALDERREDINNEDIVDALNEGRDPAAVPCLRRAVRWIPEYDEDGQLARKAVWALGRIGTPEAIAAIRDEVTPELPFKVVEAAEGELLNR